MVLPGVVQLSPLDDDADRKAGHAFGGVGQVRSPGVMVLPLNIPWRVGISRGMPRPPVAAPEKRFRFGRAWPMVGAARKNKKRTLDYVRKGRRWRTARPEGGRVTDCRQDGAWTARRHSRSAIASTAWRWMPRPWRQRWGWTARLRSTRSSAGRSSRISRRCWRRAFPSSPPAPRKRRCSRKCRRSGRMRPDVTFANIRERAGWSEEGGEARRPRSRRCWPRRRSSMPPAPTVTMKSEGVCLVYGRDEVAVDAARQLAGRLDVTLAADRAGRRSCRRASWTCRSSRARSRPPAGHLGAFDDHRQRLRAACRLLALGARLRDGAQRARLDLRPDPRPDRRRAAVPGAGEARRLFPARSGQPGRGAARAVRPHRSVGEFEKPRYVTYDAAFCAHSRSRMTGCTRCLDVCPASAIAPDGDGVTIDPFLCGGCGGCNSVCPTGAASYAMPAPRRPGRAAARRCSRPISRRAAAKPVLFVHDGRHGEEMISLIARHGRGLPAARHSRSRSTRSPRSASISSPPPSPMARNRCCCWCRRRGATSSTGWRGRWDWPRR